MWFECLEYSVCCDLGYVEDDIMLFVKFNLVIRFFDFYCYGFWGEGLVVEFMFV